MIIDPGYWLVYFNPGGTYDIVYVHMNSKTFDIIGSDISYSIENNDYSFVKKINLSELINGEN